MTNKELVEKISFYRVKRNMSACKLSESIGKSRNYINRLESNPFNIPTSVLFDILDVLGLTVEEFFCLGTEYTPEGKELLHLYNKLSANNKNTVLDLVKKLQ